MTEATMEDTLDCPSCEGTGETPTVDRWSYGRNEGHYTTGGDKCPCCDGTGQVEAIRDDGPIPYTTHKDYCCAPDPNDGPEEDWGA